MILSYNIFCIGSNGAIYKFIIILISFNQMESEVMIVT